MSESAPPGAAGAPAPSRFEAADVVGPAGLAVLLAIVVAATAAVAGGGGSGGSASAPAIVVVAAAPAAGAGVPAAAYGRDPVGASPTAVQQRLDMARFRAGGVHHVPARWIAGFYPVYDVASRVFRVNWLLIASVHDQETSFSTAPDTYSGLNFAHCCAGPMQFNVTNGPVPTWARFAGAYEYGVRPAGYPNRTATHPSVYDDFDAIMAGAWLLRAGGAGRALDGSAWQAAYDYYGHDPTGVVYADQVLARAISWSEHGFCANCALDPAMVADVHAAYGAGVAAALAGAAGPGAASSPGRSRGAGATGARSSR